MVSHCAGTVSYVSNRVTRKSLRASNPFTITSAALAEAGYSTLVIRSPLLLLSLLDGIGGNSSTSVCAVALVGTNDTSIPASRNATSVAFPTATTLGGELTMTTVSLALSVHGQADANTRAASGDVITT